jgi:hypothetical protein
MTSLIRIRSFVITDPDPAPYYLSKIQRKFRKKFIFLMFYCSIGRYLFDNMLFVNENKNVQVASGSGGIRKELASRIQIRIRIQDYGSADPDQKEIFTDPQHCIEEYRHL